MFTLKSFTFTKFGRSPLRQQASKLSPSSLPKIPWVLIKLSCHIWSLRCNPASTDGSANGHSATNNPPPKKYTFLFRWRQTFHRERPVNSWLIDTAVASHVYGSTLWCNLSLLEGKAQHYFYPVSTSKASSHRDPKRQHNCALNVHLV